MRILLMAALVPLLIASSPGPDEVVPVTQTRAFVDDASGTPANADADDPAIWVHPRSARQSVVLGTLKEGGLAAFDLSGRTLGTYPAPLPPTPDAKPGRYNNVDVLSRVPVGGRARDLAFVSDRGRDRIRVYEIDGRGAAAGASVVRDVTDPGARPVFSASEEEVDDQHTAYGLAAGVVGRTPVVVTNRRNETRVALLHVVAGPDRSVGTAVVASIDLPASFRLPDGTEWTPCGEPGERPQLEGMVVDSEHGVLYAAQEDVGIWRIPLRAAAFGTPVLIDKVRSFGVPQSYDPETEECSVSGADPGFGGKRLTADAEGLAVGDDYLIASSQGDSRFVAYERTGRNRYVGEFVVGSGRGNDSVEHSDGAHLVTADLGRDYPEGLLVLHDGERTPAAGDLDTTGFAYVSWEDVLDELD
ncbi:3-phytase [Saccharothrix ecbatanensis]|uniref:3-phytase n=1 Tax=Saccharothrix ecbatanensis TaxID=1105145 RepID=A0A7W9M5X8_9PSEU|nr:phytase [Saccharothrix ecbatanensis]MBB5808409.1 3-phytase [Saccharothrix ecbatanensis]